jgi:hypothetical protein
MSETHLVGSAHPTLLIALTTLTSATLSQRSQRSQHKSSQELVASRQIEI